MTGLAALSVIVQSGGYDRVHYGLVLASAAAAMGRPTILFFTGRALTALTRPDGWRDLDPADDGSAAAVRDAALGAAGVARLAELLDACTDLDVRIIACEMGLRAQGLDGQRLRDDLAIERAGVVTLFADTGGALVLV